MGDDGGGVMRRGEKIALGRFEQRAEQLLRRPRGRCGQHRIHLKALRPADCGRARGAGDVHGEARAPGLDGFDAVAGAQVEAGGQGRGQRAESAAQRAGGQVQAAGVVQQKEQAAGGFRIGQKVAAAERFQVALQHAPAEVEPGEIRQAAVVQARGALGGRRIEERGEAALQPGQPRQPCLPFPTPSLPTYAISCW